ncbi:MAG: hypothetical protein LW688_11810 [Cryomorphaceae bacterium]|nr:hypothetical protein [Cryomorphaceae bacterium]
MVTVFVKLLQNSTYWLCQTSALAFKDVNAKFFKRAESDILFKSTDGALIKSTLEQSMESGGRINQPISIKALNTSDELVAEFILTVSIKVIQ